MAYSKAVDFYGQVHDKFLLSAITYWESFHDPKNPAFSFFILYPQTLIVSDLSIICVILPFPE